MAKNPEKPDDYEPRDKDNWGDDEDFMHFPRISPRTQKIVTGSVAVLAVAAFYTANRLNPTKPPHVNARLVPAAGESRDTTFVRVTTPQGESLDVAANTQVEANCYDLRANNHLGGYHFIIDEGIYNGKVAQTDRGHLYTTGDPWPSTGMSRTGDPFNNLPLC